LKAAIQSGDFDLVRTITADWKQFKERCSLVNIEGTHESLLVLADTRADKDILLLLSSRIQLYNQLVHNCLSENESGLRIANSLPAAFIEGVLSENEADRRICSYMKRLKDSETYSSSAQAVCLLSTCFAGKTDEIITDGIMHSNPAVVCGALKASRLRAIHRGPSTTMQPSPTSMTKSTG
jgi:hypothetical protein